MRDIRDIIWLRNIRTERITLSPNRNSLFYKRVMLKQIVT